MSLKPEELDRLQDRSFLLAKKQIDRKVTALLLESQQELILWIEKNRPPICAHLSLNPRKISKGENYADMPYWVSDFPASMKGPDLWTFRAVVWWGHFISLSLIIAGNQKIGLTLDEQGLPGEGIYFTTVDSPWKLELSEEFVAKSTTIPFQNMLQHFQEHDFVKLSRKEKLDNINNLPQLSVLSFEKLIGALRKLA